MKVFPVSLKLFKLSSYNCIILIAFKNWDGMGSTASGGPLSYKF